LTRRKRTDRRGSLRLFDSINFHHYENDQIFNYLGDGIHEFKRPGLRLYAFYDKLGEEHRLILCTNGGKKNNKKQQQTDINRAKAIRRDYLAAKSNPNARFTINEKP
ncbi:MAG: hypothetical protein ACLFSZ_10880, partial [Puniceicoccaceae bacterium]